MKYFYLFLVLPLLLLGGFLIGQTAVAAPPQFFQTTQIIGAGLSEPTGFAFAPDGRIFILERTGAIRIYKNGSLLAQPFAVLPSSDTGDLGLIGIAFDPDFASNYFVYFYYTAQDGRNYLVRFDASGDVAVGDPTIIYSTPELSLLLHVGGTVAFGPDEKLYLSIGDNGYPPNAQNLNKPYGKVLRLNRDGTVPTDNPFIGVANALPEVYAYGLRNPFRFQFDSATGFMYVADVGQDNWEEVNHVVVGGNYGWPFAEGMCTASCPYQDPIYVYPHNGESHSISGGPVYRGSMFPSDYVGSLFFGDYAAGFIKRLTLDTAGNSTGAHDFDLGAGSVVDMKVAPDGSLYYITYYPGRLYRVSYSETNQIPVASAGADVTKGLNPLTVHFLSAGSLDPDGDPLTYLWDFGDNSTSTEANPTKVYQDQGVYIVELYVSDGENTAQAVPLVIQVGTPPTIFIAAPTDGDTYRAGDTITYTATGMDGAGFDLPGTAYTTEVLMHHATHIHPFLGPIQSQSGEFTIPINGEPSAGTWYEVKITGTDTTGLTDTKSVFIYPEISEMTFLTQPVGLRVDIDGQPVVTPQTITGVIGFHRELKAPLQSLDGQVYQFSHWEDGGPAVREIITPETNTTYTAYYIPVDASIGEYFDNKTLSGAPLLNREDAEINFNWDQGSPDPSLPVDNFSVRWTVVEYFPSGEYTFTARADDGIRVYLDDELILDKWIDQPPTTYTVTYGIPEGEHLLKVEYFEHGGGAEVRLDYIKTGEIIPLDGFAASFWNTPGAGAAPVIPSTPPDLTRVDPIIAFNWDGAPDPLIAPDHFVARWIGEKDFTEGTYRFTTNSDDGVRLYIDGVLVINNWTDHAPTINTADVELVTGSHELKLEFYENTGGAVIQLSYGEITPEPPAEGSFNGEYYSNRTLSGTPTLVREDTVINFNWQYGSPDPTLPSDDFSARWTKTETFTAGTYEFTATADDGIRIYLDDVLILDKWIDQGPTTYTVEKSITAGDHTIKVEYYENGGGAVAQVSYIKTGDVTIPSSGYTAEFWNAGTGAAPTIPAAAPNLTRTDTIIDFDWGVGSPGAPITADHFIARWTGSFEFIDSTYRFTATADDGVRVKLDGQLVIDKWIDQGPTTYTADVAVTAGMHEIIVEYYENSIGAVASFSYDITSGAPLAGFTGEYFANQDLSGAPLLTRQDTFINFIWNDGSPDPLIPVDNFSTRWTKTDTYTAGNHTFTTKSDDGVRLWVDDVLVIDNWTDHGMTTDSAVVNLTAGEHLIKMEYYENGGGAIAILTEN